MPKLVLDEPLQEETPKLVLDETVPVKQDKNPRLVLDEPKFEEKDTEKILRNFFENPVANSWLVNTFKKGEEIVNLVADKVEKIKNPLVPDTSMWRYFPSYFAHDFIRFYTPTNITLAEVGGVALGITGKAIAKYVPQGLKEKVGRLLVYRFGQPQAYKELAENRLLNIAKGFEKAQEVGTTLSEGLNKAEQFRLGQIMRGSITTNPRLQALAEPARKLVDDLSQELIKQGVPSEKLAEVIQNNLGTYLPRLYRTKEIEKSLTKLFVQKKPLRIDLSRLKRRQDIPELVRQQMGEIKEAAYPTAKAVGQMTQMTETAKLFNSVATNPEWMSDVATEGFEKLAENKALGTLSGKYVLKTIANDVNDIVRIDPLMFRQYKKALSLWKAGKTILNPATHVRNMMSNTMLLDMSGVNHIQQTVLLPRALKELISKGNYYKEAQSVGLLGKEFYGTELKGLIDSYLVQSNNFIELAINSTTNLFKKGFKTAGNIYQSEEQWFKLAKFISERERGSTIKDAASEASKWLFDYTQITPFVKKVRETVAPFATFTYKVIPRLAETVVEHPLKIYKYMALAKAFEGASEKTLGVDKKESADLRKYLPEWLKGFGKYALLMPFQDKDGRYQYLDLTYILPIGLVSNLTEKGGIGGLVSNPILSAFTELRSNIQTITGKKIVEDTDTPMEANQKRLDYIYRQLMPSLAPAIPNITKGGYSWQKMQSALEGRSDYFGRERSVPLSALDVFMGLKINPVDIKQQKMFNIKEKRKQIMDLRFQAKSISRNKSLRPEERRKEIEKIKEKIRIIKNEK